MATWNSALQRTVGIVLLLAAAWATARVEAAFPVLGGMLDPAIDEPGKPFSYFGHPTDVIGTLYAPVASEVTPEGYVYTGFGELMFFVDNPPEPVNVRIKTLRKGWLPVVEYDLCRHQVKYSFRILAADLGGPLAGLPVNFVEVRLENQCSEPRAAFLSSAFRCRAPGGFRFGQRFDLIPKKYTEGQTGFNSRRQYEFAAGTVIRDGRLLYAFPQSPAPDQFGLSLYDKGLSQYRYFTGEVEGDPTPRVHQEYDTPLGVVTYRVPLAPGEAQTLVFKMPIAPLPADGPEAALVLAADGQEQLHATEAFWETLVAKPCTLCFPEVKVQEALLANTVFDLLAIDKVGEDYITNVNKFQYHTFCGGSDPAHMRVAFDYVGLTDIGRKTALYSAAFQYPDGSFETTDAKSKRTPRYEFSGLNLWCLGRHWQLTRDTSYLKQVYPCVVKAMDYLVRLTTADALGVVPPYQWLPDDAALHNVRQTGATIWALHGMLHAIGMAEGMGRATDVARFQADYQRLRTAFEKQLARQTAASGGWIPPALEKTLLGNQWDNLLLLYPEPLFAPFDPRVTATIRASRACYREGILGYVYPRAIAKQGTQVVFNTDYGLHYWHTLDNAQNALVRGGEDDQRLAVQDLYALLLHTTSTHAPQEFSGVPWWMRDYHSSDILPDGPASAKLIELLRNMLVREYRDELHLFSALSPEWLRAGRRIEVRGAPTSFGPVRVCCAAQADGLRIELSHAFRQAPRALVIRVPWCYTASAVTVDGRRVDLAGNTIRVSPQARRVHIAGQLKPGVAPLSFAQVVRDYKQEYARRYQEFLRTGTVRP
jgi:hypothetical protein